VKFVVLPLQKHSRRFKMANGPKTFGSALKGKKKFPETAEFKFYFYNACHQGRYGVKHMIANQRLREYF
jgi:hypothetical protein